MNRSGVYEIEKTLSKAPSACEVICSKSVKYAWAVEAIGGEDLETAQQTHNIAVTEKKEQRTIKNFLLWPRSKNHYISFKRTGHINPILHFCSHFLYSN